jgi:hypothetical protein
VDTILWVICACFGVWELFAHFVARNRGAHTLSNRIWAMQNRWPRTRWLVRGACVVLLLHLGYQTF